MPSKQIATSKLKPAARFGQQQLFNDSQFATPEKKPGEMSLDEWTETQDPVYHGSFRSDFDRAPTAHYGNMDQAADRLSQVSNWLENTGENDRETYYNPASAFDASGVDPEPRTHTGHVYSRRLTEQPDGVEYGDSVANAADMGYRYEEADEEWEIPKSITQSAGTVAPVLNDIDGTPTAKHVSDSARFGHESLKEGRPIQYRNAFEGSGEDSSIVAPSQSVTSWERDVIREPRASPMSQQFAQQRIRQGKEGAVPFPGPSPQRQPEQLQIPIAYDDHERKSLDTPGTGIGATKHRWHEITGKADQSPQPQRPTLQQFQFEA